MCEDSAKTVNLYRQADEAGGTDVEVEDGHVPDDLIEAIPQSVHLCRHEML
jgi:hypothetical protein